MVGDRLDVGGDVGAVEAGKDVPEALDAARILAHRADQRRLRTEVAEQRRFVDAGAFGNLTRGRPARAVALEDLAGRGEDPRARFFDPGMSALWREHQLFFSKTAGSTATLVW